MSRAFPRPSLSPPHRREDSNPSSLSRRASRGVRARENEIARVYVNKSTRLLHGDHVFERREIVAWCRTCVMRASGFFSWKKKKTRRMSRKATRDGMSDNSD